VKHRRPLIVVISGVVALAAAIVWGMTVGPASIPMHHLIGILGQSVGIDLGESSWRAWEATVLLDVRLPRLIVGAFVGGGLALCGSAMQGFFRNPLADPGVIGVSSGAALGAVVAIHLGLTLISIWMLPVFALAGAMGTAWTVYALATRRGCTSVTTLLLAGVAMGSLTGALTSLVLSVSLAQWDVGRQMMDWLLGGLEGRTWAHVQIVAPATLIGSGLVLVFSGELDALLLGEAHATAIGVEVPRVRRWLIFATSLVTGATVAVAGLIGFVGLIIPHTLRHLIGPGHRWLLPASLLWGAAFVVITDSLARQFIGWAGAGLGMQLGEIRLGVITAGLGAPFFLVLLMRHRRGEMFG